MLVPKEDTVFISNFRVNRNEINVNMSRIPTSIKLGFAELQKKYCQTADYVCASYYDEKKEFKRENIVLEKVCQSGRPLLLKDASDPAAYRSFNSSYFDYAGFLGKGRQKRIMEYKQKNIVSEICIPVIYLASDHTHLPLGYVHMQSRSKYFSEHDVKNIWNGIMSIMGRIRKSNTILISEREKIINLSQNSFTALIRGKELTEKLRKQKTFIFDLFFRMQAPITLYGFISKFKDTGDGLQISIQIKGNSSRPREMERLYENIQELEKAVFLEAQEEAKEKAQAQSEKQKEKQGSRPLLKERHSSPLLLKAQ